MYNASEDLNTECTFSGDLDHDDTDDFQQEESESSSDESDISVASENVPLGRLDCVKKKKKKKIYEPCMYVYSLYVYVYRTIKDHGHGPNSPSVDSTASIRLRDSSTRCQFFDEGIRGVLAVRLC